MTTSIETLREAIARRLRGQLAERRITQRRLGELTGWSAMYISRRTSGEQALDADDLETIQHVTGISVRTLITGEADQTFGHPFGSGRQPSTNGGAPDPESWRNPWGPETQTMGEVDEDDLPAEAA